MTLPKLSARQHDSLLVGLFAVYGLVLILWKTALWLYLPLPTEDGVQSLSHTYSILRGNFFQSIFLHNWMTIFQLPYGFGLVTAPLMGLLPFGTINNYYVTSLIFALVAAIITYALLVTAPAHHSKGFAALAGIALFVYPHVWVMRPESITVPLLLVCVFLLRRYHEYPRPAALIGGAFVVVCAGVTHPMGGLIGVLMVSLMAFEHRWRWQHLFGFYALVGLFLALLYLPIVLMSVHLWIVNFIGFFTSEQPRGLSTLGGVKENFPRFVAWGLPLLLLYGVGLLAFRRKLASALLRDLLFAAVFALPIILGANGHYFIYLMVFLIWRLAVWPYALSIRVPLAAVILIIAPLWTHYLPTFQNFEDPRYAETVRAIQQQVSAYANNAQPGLIWISTSMALPIIDQPNARDLMDYYQGRFYPQPLAVNSGDVFLYDKADEAQLILDNYAVSPNTIQTEQLIAPVRGPLTFESFLRQRLPSIGLWRVTLRPSASNDSP